MLWDEDSKKFQEHEQMKRSLRVEAMNEN